MESIQLPTDKYPASLGNSWRLWDASIEQRSAALAPVCPCLPSTGPSAPGVALPELSRGAGSSPWTCWTALPHAAQYTPPVTGLQLGFVLVIAALWAQYLSQFSVHLSVHWPSYVPVLLYNNLSILTNTAKWCFIKKVSLVNLYYDN